MVGEHILIRCKLIWLMIGAILRRHGADMDGRGMRIVSERALGL